MYSEQVGEELIGRPRIVASQGGGNSVQWQSTVRPFAKLL